MNLVRRVLGWSAVAAGCVLVAALHSGAAGAAQRPQGPGAEHTPTAFAVSRSTTQTAGVPHRYSLSTAGTPAREPRALNRVVCDNRRDVGNSYWCEVSDIRGFSATTVGRVENDPADENLDQQVHLVYDLLGFTSDYYLSRFGYDLTKNIGLRDASDPTYVPVLSATVNTCANNTGSICDGGNAYWMPGPGATADDPRDFVGGTISIGAGLAGISDIIAHELQHGVTDSVANLSYQGQAGAINESISDIFGELVDRAKQIRDYKQVVTDWTIGDGYAWTGLAREPLPYLRSLSDPYSRPPVAPTKMPGQAANCRGWQPDRMSSPCWDTDPRNEDYGGVHTNSGVGNKAAFLMSSGGVFNNRTIVGMGDDATARLWWATLPKLTSSATYYELGNDLASTCTSLEASGVLPLKSCALTVRPAIAATEMASRRVTFGALPTKVRAGAVITPVVRVYVGMRPDISLPMYGQTVYLQARSGSRWVAVAKAKTDVLGAARFRYRVRSGGVYRLALAANQVLPEIGSPRVTIRLG